MQNFRRALAADALSVRLLRKGDAPESHLDREGRFVHVSEVASGDRRHFDGRHMRRRNLIDHLPSGD